MAEARSPRRGLSACDRRSAPEAAAAARPQQHHQHLHLSRQSRGEPGARRCRGIAVGRRSRGSRIMTAVAGPQPPPRRRVWFPETLDPDVEIAAALVQFRFDVRLALRGTVSASIWLVSDVRRSAAAICPDAVAYLSDRRPGRLAFDSEELRQRRSAVLGLSRRPSSDDSASGGSCTPATSMTSRHGCVTAATARSPPIRSWPELTTCLRVMHEERPGTIPRACSTRLRHVASHYYGKGRPRDAYSDRVRAASLREAARREVLAIHQRIASPGRAF